MKAEYPKRGSHFAHKLVRLMFRACAAQEIGTDGLTLVALIAHTEDAKRYSGPVTFWNNQLLPILGFNSWGQLDRARDKAVKGGWLHYECGGKRQVGRYWSTIPGDLTGFDDTDISCDHHAIVTKNGDNDVIEPREIRGASGDRTVIEPREIRGASGDPSTLSLTLTLPKPNTTGANSSHDESSEAKPDPYSEDFERLWKVWPRRENKRAAFKAFKTAKKRKSVADIMEAATALAASPKGKGNYCPHLASWLNADGWADDRAAWQRSGENGHATPKREEQEYKRFEFDANGECTNFEKPKPRRKPE